MTLGREIAGGERTVGDRYRLLSLLGEGAVGQVFEAECLAGDDAVAIKMLKCGGLEVSSRTAKRFAIEARAAQAVEHPGVVKVHELARTPEGVTYLVMERLYGLPLSSILRARRVPLARKLEWLREACEAVGAAHLKGVTHRDLKPSNILLHRAGANRIQVKVLDFGMAKLLDSGELSLTRTGEVLGTPLYMSPEQLRGEQRGDPVGDVYSLGVVLFELLAGRPPLRARSFLEMLQLHRSTPTPHVSDFFPEISPELEQIVRRCLARNPEKRYSDAQQLAGALAAVASITRVGATEPAPAGATSLRWEGTTLEDRYTLDRWLAPGRFLSDVYEATDLRTGASVAVRIWATDAQQSTGEMREAILTVLRREAKASGVRHPNLLSVRDLGFTDDAIYLVTELVEGLSLREFLEQQGPLPLDQAVPLIRGAAEALAVLHEKGMTSGGFSLDTVRVVTPGGTSQPGLLVSPFGLEKLRELAEPLGRSAADGSSESDAIDYVSPEQVEDRAPGPHSDIYPLGLIFVQMLRGGIVSTIGPEAGSTIALTTAEIDATLLPENLSDEWKQFLRGCLAPDPSKRFENAQTFLAALPDLDG